MAVADKNHSFIISGTGDVLEPEDGIIGIGSEGLCSCSCKIINRD